VHFETTKVCNVHILRLQTLTLSVPFEATKVCSLHFDTTKVCHVHILRPQNLVVSAFSDYKSF